MSDIKLFKLNKAGVEELQSSSVSLEKSLQTLIEKNLAVKLGQSEFVYELNVYRVVNDVWKDFLIPGYWSQSEPVSWTWTIFSVGSRVSKHFPWR
ncbi:MAG: hypothetical protein WAX69_22465 [Victivallales bacterium]